MSDGTNDENPRTTSSINDILDDNHRPGVDTRGYHLRDEGRKSKEESTGEGLQDLGMGEITMCHAEQFRYCPRPQATVRLQMNQYVRTYTIPHTDNIEIEVHLDPNAGFEESLKVIRDALTGAGVRP